MPVGFESINTTGSYQILDGYINLQYKEKATVTMTQSYLGPFLGDQRYYYYDIVVNNAKSPMVAFNSTEFVALISLSISGTTWTFRAAMSYTGPPGYSPTFTYYVIDQGVATASGVGLEIFDSTGELSFSSGARNIDVKAFMSGLTLQTQDDYQWWQGSWEGVSNRTYAYIFGPTGASVLIITNTVGKDENGDPIYAANQYYSWGAAKIINSGTTVSYRTDAITYNKLENYPQNLGAQFDTTFGNIIIIDVTGI